MTFAGLQPVSREDKRPMNILVTGGAGYIGSAVARQLKQRAVGDVVLLDNFSNGSKQAAKLTGCPLYIAGIEDYYLMGSIIERHRIDLCIHTAASIDATESMVNPSRYFHNNVAGTAELLDALRDHGVKKIVFSSSVLAGQEQNVYGWTKRTCEKMLDQYYNAYGFSYVGLRFENVVGATDGLSQWHRDNQTHLIPNLMDVAYGDKQYITIYGDGKAERDYVHIEDIVSAHLDAVRMLDTWTPGRIYTIGSGNRHSVSEVVTMAGEVTGRAIPIVFGPTRKDAVYGSTGADAQASYRVKTELGYKPTKNLRDILESAWKWKQANPKGYTE